MSTRSSEFSAGQDLTSTTNIAAHSIWILHTSAFFFFSSSIQKLMIYLLHYIYLHSISLHYICLHYSHTLMSYFTEALIGITSLKF